MTYLTDALLRFLRHTLLKWCRRLQKVQVLLNAGHLRSLWQWVYCPQPRHGLCIVRGGDLRRVRRWSGGSLFERGGLAAAIIVESCRMTAEDA